jgi:hypothetical protein
MLPAVIIAIIRAVVETGTCGNHVCRSTISFGFDGVDVEGLYVCSDQEKRSRAAIKSITHSQSVRILQKRFSSGTL